MGSLAVGGYEVAVRPWAYSTWVDVRADTDVVRLRVPEPLAVPVVTTDAATGAVVTGATVRIDDVPSLDPSTVRDPEALWPRIESRRTGSVLRALPGTSAALRVDAPGYAPVLLTAAVDGDAEGDVVLSVPLPRPATVRVVVPGGSPVAAPLRPPLVADGGRRPVERGGRRRRPTGPRPPRRAALPPHTVGRWASSDSGAARRPCAGRLGGPRRRPRGRPLSRPRPGHAPSDRAGDAVGPREVARARSGPGVPARRAVPYPRRRGARS